MAKYGGAAANKGNYTPDLSTGRQRKAALQSIINQLRYVLDNEEQYLNNIPTNLQGGEIYQTAVQCI